MSRAFRIRKEAVGRHSSSSVPFFSSSQQSRKIPRVQIKDDLMRRSFQETFAYIADRRLLELLLVGLD